MDLVLEQFDNYVLDDVYAATTRWPREYIVRQAVSVYCVVWLMSHALYFVFSTLDFYLLFDRSLLQHKLALKNQVRKEIGSATWGLFIMGFYTLPVWLAELRGYSKLYTSVADNGGWTYVAISIVGFIFFTDFCIYWIHRVFHHPALYTFVHKEHHRWKVPTPFASIAFTPIDGFMQGFPYHLFVFLFPLQRHLYLLLFFGVQLWSISIHDQVYVTYGSPLRGIVNGADHHIEHHLKFNYNYGQFFTLQDKLWGTHLPPTKEAVTLAADVRRASGATRNGGAPRGRKAKTK